jgi:NtrC-family two-component system sensor histidine kinase KinB
MRLQRLQTRFLLAGCLLVAATAGSGLWSALTFARLSGAADDALREGQEKIDLVAGLAGSLEREDDALLLALSGEVVRARRDLNAERRRGDNYAERLLAALDESGDGDDSVARALRADMNRYRVAGAELIGAAGRPGALERYHRHVNPLLRQVVVTCGKIREENFVSMRRAGLRARDEAARSTGVVAGLSAAALALATAVSTWLARSVLRPVRAMTESVEALRQGAFDRRVCPTSADELGRLAEGFNRLTEALAEYRRSSLGDLLAAKMTLEATLNALPDAVLVVAPDGTLAGLNPLAQAVLEAKHAVGAERLQDLLLSPEHRESVDAALAGRPSVSSRTDFALALPAILNGRLHKFLLTAAPIPEFAPRRCGAVIVLDDVTEFARLDELRGELIGVASHELKTPLTTLRMTLLLLGEEADNLTPRQHELLEAALRGCEELGGTIDELLDVTRIEAGRLRLDLGPVDLAIILEQAVRPLWPRFEDAGVRLAVVRGPGPAVVQGDMARLRTVLTNLLTNALKYSPPGGTVTVQMVSGQSAGVDGLASLQVAVTDQGPGIPAEFRERVFEKFFRVEHDRVNDANGNEGREPRLPVPGTGIGLYLCREIIKAHGGSIRCAPGDGGSGTRVAITLPLSL